MADYIDEAQAFTEAHIDRSIAAARVPIARGQPGECEACVEDSPRLVMTGGLMLCARCRDKREKRR